jgi:MFS family permease
LEKQTSKYRWLVLASVLFAYFVIVTQRTAPGLISDQLMKEFNISASMIGLLASIQFLAYAGLQIPIGILSDRFGPNLFLISGTVLDGVGTLIYSFAPNEMVLLVARLIVGLGDAAIWVNLVLILSRWFKAREFIGLIGFAGMSGSLGFLATTVPFSAWIAMTSWRTSFFTTGIILCLCGALLSFVLIKGEKRFAKTEVTKATKSVDENEKVFNKLKRVFSDRQAYATFLCHFGLVGTYIGFIGSWAVPYGMHIYGMTRSGSSELIMIGLIGALIGAPLTGFLASRMGSIKRPYVTVHIIVFLSWTAFLLYGGKPPFFMAIILFFIIGYGNGASSLTFAVVRESFPIKEVGVVSGFANTGGFISAILLPAIFGNVLDHFHSPSSQIGYTYGFIIPIVFSLLGLVGGLLIKDKQREIAAS